MMLGNTQPITTQVSKTYENNRYTINAFNIVSPQTTQNDEKIAESNYETITNDYMTLNSQYTSFEMILLINKNIAIAPNMDMQGDTAYQEFYIKTNGINSNVETELNIPIGTELTKLTDNTIENFYLMAYIFTNTPTQQVGTSIYAYYDEPWRLVNDSTIGFNYGTELKIINFNTNDLTTFTISTMLKIPINIVKGTDTEVLVWIYPYVKATNDTWITFNYSNQQSQNTWLINNISPTITGINRVYLTTEVIDMPNIMWTILTMPFTFISVAFNLTLWPGTQFAVDIGNLILALLGIMIFIFIMKVIIKAAAGAAG